MKLNNKGQTLITFIVLIPTLIIIFALIIELGVLAINKRKIENEVKSAITYGLKSKDENIDLKIRKLLIKNIDNIKDKNIDIKVDNNYIKISLVSKNETLFRILKDKFSINVTYIGTIENNRIKIIKE